MKMTGTNFKIFFSINLLDTIMAMKPITDTQTNVKAMNHDGWMDRESEREREKQNRT